MKNVKILFQGDSITDAGRNYNDPHDLGGGYPLYAAQALQEQNPDISFEFINLGIGGNQTIDLVARVQSDVVDIQPDIISILIGGNDVLRHADLRDWVPHEEFEARYRLVLDKIKNETNAKIMIMEPYLMPIKGNEYYRDDLAPKIEVVRKLAREYADVYLPTEGLLHSAFIGDDPQSFLADEVHPTKKGSQYIAALYVQYIQKLL